MHGTVYYSIDISHVHTKELYFPPVPSLAFIDFLYVSASDCKAEVKASHAWSLEEEFGLIYKLLRK